MAHGVIEDSVSERVIKLSAFPDVLEEEFTVSGEIGSGIPLCVAFESATDCPVRRIDRRSANAITVFQQEGTHAIAFLRRVTFLEVRVAKQTHEVRVVANQGFVLKG